jgi:hypothetical protein
MQARLVTLTKMEWHSQLRSKKFSKKGKMKKVFNVVGHQEVSRGSCSGKGSVGHGWLVLLGVCGRRAVAFLFRQQSLVYY